MSTLIQTITSDLAVWTLAGDDPRVAGIARGHVRRVLAGHPAIDGATVVTSELVTNAHLHSLSGQEGGAISVGVALGKDEVSIVVGDSGAAEACDDRIDNGRGLMICMAFGHVAIEDGPDGRTVTVTIPARGAER